MADHPHLRVPLSSTIFIHISSITHHYIVMSSSSKVPSTQGLWKISSSTFRDHDSFFSNIEIRNRPIDVGKHNGSLSKVSSKSARPPFRSQIGIKCPDVEDISFQAFWTKHKYMLSTEAGQHPGDIVSVTVIAGSLSRDRIEEKSCASYDILCYPRTDNLTLFVWVVQRGINGNHCMQKGRVERKISSPDGFDYHRDRNGNLPIYPENIVTTR